MNAKEKALDLFHQFLNAGTGITSDYLAYQSAFICVQELINSNAPNQKFWLQVKKELKLLSHFK